MSTNWIDDLPADLGRLVTALQRSPDFPRRLAELAASLRQRHREKGRVAHELALRAWELAPDNERVRALTNWAFRRAVDGYQFGLVRDASRMQAYDAAMRELVTPETVVLEIGTGTGVVAMMAARAGARHVYTCETSRLVAEAAREIIASNGFADRVSVIAKPSSEVVIGRDMAERADLLVHDLIAVDLLGMNVLEVTEDARARLLRPGAIHVPAQVALRGVLIGGEPWSTSQRLGVECGFDLSAFNRLAQRSVMYQPAEQTLDGALTSSAEVLRFDLSAGLFPPEKHTVSLTATRDATAEGFMSWLWVGLTDSVWLENKPTALSLDRHAFTELFSDPIAVEAGQNVLLSVGHDRHSISIEPDLGSLRPHPDGDATATG